MAVTQRVAAILAADAVGYTRLMAEDEPATIETLDAARQIFVTHIEANQGRVVDTAGDSVLAVFGTTAGAVQAAVSIQDRLAKVNELAPDNRRMLFRIGIHLGDVHEKRDGTVYGDGVNVAARMQSIAEPGAIIVSDGVQGALRGRVDVGFADAGTHNVKNITGPIHAYCVTDVGAKPSQAPRQRLARVVLACVTIVVALAASAAWWLTREDLPPPVLTAEDKPTNDQVLASTESPSIAVLPFTNMSDDADQEYFANGISEDLITELSRFEGLMVIARNSSFQFKSRAVNIAEVATVLGVRYVLEGGVRRSGDRVRITVQLIDAETGGHLWAERYDREMTDIFAVQDDVTEQIITALKSEIGELAPTRGDRPLTSSHEAYDLYLHGRALKDRRTKETNARAQELFESAIELDGAFAAAYAEFAHAKLQAWYYGWIDGVVVLEDAEKAAEKAVALDHSLPLAHDRLAWILAFRNRLDKAIAAARQATALDTNYASGYSTLSNMLGFGGETDEALAMADIAIKLDPYSFIAEFGRGWAHFVAGDYEQAAVGFRASLALNPDFGAGHQYLAATYGILGREPEALAAAAEVLRLSPNFANGILRSPFRNPDDLMRLVGGLRKAGLDVPDPPSNE